jgi:hypothetical protein
MKLTATLNINVPLPKGVKKFTLAQQQAIRIAVTETLIDIFDTIEPERAYVDELATWPSRVDYRVTVGTVKTVRA